MIDLGKIKQAERGTLTLTWEFPDSLTSPASISGATITATMLNLGTGDVTAVTGTLTATGATTVTWALSAGDSGTAGTFHVTFRADVSGVPTYTLNAVIEVEENPAATAVQNQALVGVTSAEAAWVTAGETAVPDGADLLADAPSDGEQYVRQDGAWVAVNTSGAGYFFQAETIASGETVTVPAGYQMLVYGALDVAGTLDVAGRLAVL